MFVAFHPNVSNFAHNNVLPFIRFHSQLVSSIGRQFESSTLGMNFHKSMVFLE